MLETHRLLSHAKTACRPAVALLAAVLLLSATPVLAGWLDRGIGVAGVGHALKETLAENTGIFGELVSAFIDGDDEKVKELAGDVAKTPGKLIRRAFPVLEAPQAVAQRLKSAKQRVERFVGRVGETLADARAALAFDNDPQDGGWSDAALLEGGPLPVPAGTAFAAPDHASPTEALAAFNEGAESKTTGANPAADSWDFDQWVIAKQEASPHCYGVVDLDTLPADCFGQAGAESPATNKVEESSQADAAGWASGEWTIEDDGWAGWDKSDTRYSDADRDAARVGVFAAECWGVYGVSRHGPMHDLMRERMQRNECPSEDTSRAAADTAAVPGDDGYLSALGDLAAEEEQERRLAEEQRRLEVEERERQARMEEERRQEEDRMAARRRLEQQEFNRQAAQQLGQALGGLIRAYSGDGTTGGSGTTGGNGIYSAMCSHTCWNGSVIRYKCRAGMSTRCPPNPAYKNR